MTAQERREYYLHRSKGRNFFRTAICYTGAFISFLIALIIIIYFVILSYTGHSPLKLIKMKSFNERIEALGYTLDEGESLNAAIESIAKQEKITINIEQEGLDASLEKLEKGAGIETKTERIEKAKAKAKAPVKKAK